MIYLIEYDRSSRRLLYLAPYSDVERSAAEGARLELELLRHREGVHTEIVLLEARDEAALRRTHQRYFSTLAEILSDSRALTSSH